MTYTKLSDEALMKRLQNRDNKALEELYNRYFKKLYYFSIKMLNNDKETANDMVQDVFLKLVDSPDKFNTEKKFKSWIYTITANECRKHYRLKPMRNIDNEEIEITLHNEVENNSESLSFFVQKMDKQLEQLSDRHKEAFILKHNQDFSLQEIAELQNCALGTVKSRLHYTTKFLAENLSQYKSMLTK
ncbi:RNA polymerase sigma factor [Flavobacteriales bacterium]|nr:RNA polymerase sigma factor [Flavobacteriales bacterium]